LVFAAATGSTTVDQARNATVVRNTVELYTVRHRCASIDRVGGHAQPGYGTIAWQVNGDADRYTGTGTNMLAVWVKVRVKPEERECFLKAIEIDALGATRDEPGGLRFNVLRDAQDPNVYSFLEVYRNKAALEAHRAAPHYAVWRADTLDGPAAATRCDSVIPAAIEHWEKAPILPVNTART
jgi:autoinducer 2-degrading protein